MPVYIHLSPSNALSHFDQYWHYLEKAIEHDVAGNMDAESIRGNIENKHFHVIEIRTIDGLNGVACLEVIRRERGHLLNVVLLGGESMSDWLEGLIEELTFIAKGLDCVGVVCLGRLGWGKALSDFGFNPVQTMMLLEVHNGKYRKERTESAIRQQPTEQELCRPESTAVFKQPLPTGTELF